MDVQVEARLRQLADIAAQALGGEVVEADGLGSLGRAVEAGVDVGQQGHGLNFSDPGLLLDTARQGLGIALVSQLLA